MMNDIYVGSLVRSGLSRLLNLSVDSLANGACSQTGYGILTFSLTIALRRMVFCV